MTGGGELAWEQAGFGTARGPARPGLIPGAEQRAVYSAEELEDHVEEPVLPEIRRRSRITMRDPQQPGLGSVPLEDLSRNAEGVYQHASVSAEDIIRDARATAASMVEQARLARDAELEAARKSGHQAGYEAGYGDGMDLADRESAALIATAEQIAINVAAERDRLLTGAEADMVELAIDIAERIVNASLDVQPELVLEVCKGAMRKAFQRDQLTVLAHPDDLTMLRDAGPELMRELGGIHQLDFVEERRVDRGSVIVRTPVGEIDGTFAGKREKISDALRELAEQRRAVQAEALNDPQADGQ